MHFLFHSVPDDELDWMWTVEVFVEFLCKLETSIITTNSSFHLQAYLNFVQYIL